MPSHRPLPDTPQKIRCHPQPYRRQPKPLNRIAQMVVRAAGRIQIMAGSGVNPQNCRQFIDVGVDAVHTSARTVRDSAMVYRRPGISMGGLTEVAEFEIAVASEELIRATIQQVQLD